MSTPSGRLKLKGLSGEETFYNARADISGDYTKAEVVPSEPKSFWVVYTVKDWDHQHPGDRDVEKIVRVGATVTTDAPIRSIQGFDELNPGVILFEHSQYRGFGTSIRNSDPDIIQSFAQGQVSGASSMIIIGGIWSFYTGCNFTGTKIIVCGKTQLGPGIYDLELLLANDQIKSVQYVRAS